MDQSFLSKFNQYDLFGYLLVGSVAVLVITFDIVFFFNFHLPAFELSHILFWIIVTYLIGHFVQGLVSFMSKIPFVKKFISGDKENFEEKDKEILKDIKEYFKVKSDSNSYIWNICYFFALNKDQTGQIQAFSSYYSLYRGWFLIFILEFIFLIIYFFFGKNSCDVLGLAILSLLAAFIFHIRSEIFWSYLRNKVIQFFIINKSKRL